MDKKFDARNKVARATEQEYAHQYTPKTREENYQYSNEDKRVTYHTHDIDDNKTQDELYNVTIDSTIPTTTPNVIKTVVTVKDVTEDHRQRSYKVKNQPQIYSKTDPDIDTMQNQNDPREDEINKLRETSQAFADQIAKEQSVDMTSPVGRFSEEATPEVNGEDDCEIVFNIGDKVMHTEEKIAGEIKFANDKRLAVVWEDQTRERFTVADAKEYLKVTKAYVGDVQERIDPIHTPDPRKNEELDKKVSDALSSIEADEEVVQASIDIEKVKLQRRVNELTSKVNENNVEQVKKMAATELVELMQKKGLLGQSEDEVDNQMNTIMAMGDVAYEAFKNAIVSTKKATVANDDMYAFLDEEDESYDDIEDGAEMARQREAIKKDTSASRSVDGFIMGDTSMFENGGLSNFKGNVGDFSKSAGGESGSRSTASQETRSLSASSQKRKPIEKQSSKFDMSGFQDIQGLKAPINIPNKDLNSRGKFDDLFSQLGWSGIPKK